MEELPFLIVLAVRLLLPLLILRWNFWGGMAALGADFLDAMLLAEFGAGSIFRWDKYHTWDKSLDLYYLSLEFVALRSWKNSLARKTGQILFFWRLTGFMAYFFLFEQRIVFLLAPNIFEFFFLFWSFMLQFFPKFRLTNTRLVILLFLLGIPKIWQEFIIHVAEPGSAWEYFKSVLFFWQ